MHLNKQHSAFRSFPVCCVVLAVAALSACGTTPSADSPPVKQVAADKLRPLTRANAALPMRDFQKSLPGGTTVLRLNIDVDGKVEDVRIDKTSGNASVDSAAARSLVGAKFAPYRENGVAIPVTTLLPVTFPASNCIMAKPLDC